LQFPIGLKPRHYGAIEVLLLLLLLLLLMRTIRAFGQQRSCSTAQLANYAARLVNSAVDQMRCTFGQLRSYSARLVNCCAVGQLPRVWTTLSSAQRYWPNAQIGQTRLTWLG